MAGEIYLTREGKEKLERELSELVEVKRPELARKLKEAVAEGDLKENANYHDAKEQQGFLESRIREIEATLRAAIIIEEGTEKGVVNVGSEVTVMEEGFDETEVYKIVGAAEADPAKGFISNESPLGAALLGKKKGNKVQINTPDGKLVFVVKDVK